MNIHDCGAPLSRRLVKIANDLRLELTNNGDSEITAVHIVGVSFPAGAAEGKSTVRIAFEDVPTLKPRSTVVLTHTTYLFDDHNGWYEANAESDSIILLTDKSAKGPSGLDVAFEMNGQNCYQELGAGKGSGLTLNQN